MFLLDFIHFFGKTRQEKSGRGLPPELTLPKPLAIASLERAIIHQR
jgi:hypothetical protein